MTFFKDRIKTIEQAKAWIETLVADGKDFHFDDDPHEVIDYGKRDEHGVCARVFDDAEADLVCERVDELAAFDWGEYECPIGYVLHVTSEREKAR